MLFPGHGAELPRMGLALANAHPPAARLLEHAGECGGFDAVRVLRRGGDRLSNTRVLQPLMTAVLLGIVDALAAGGVHPDIALGHSLGELSAWSALGGVGATATIELAATRGRGLDAITTEHPGAMLALPALTSKALDDALRLGRAHGVVDPALHSAPDRWVLSGDRPALQHVAERFGGSFVPTSGAWHCRHMTPARAVFAEGLRVLDGTITPTPTLICNQTGDWLGETDPVPSLLAQIDGPVRFAECMQTLRGAEPRAVIAVGPPKVTRSLVRANWGEIAEREILVAETPRDIERVIEVLG